MTQVRTGRVTGLALLMGVMAAGMPHAAQAQEEARRKATEDTRHAEEARRMSDARRAADRAVDRKSYVNADVGREELGRLNSPSTPRPAASASGSPPAKGLAPK